VEFLGDVLADGPVPASQVKEEAEDAGISERTLKRAKKMVGVFTYRENESGGKRGTGRWMWKQPVVQLVEEDIRGDRVAVQGGQGVSEENVGTLGRGKGTETREIGIGKPDLQEGQQRPSRRTDVQEGQGTNPVEDGIVERCNHGYPRGKGCYLCDPDHPYRKKEITA
jgi:hypothetical protein